MVLKYGSGNRLSSARTRVTNFCIWILFSNITGPRCASVSTVEDSSQPVQWREHKTPIKNYSQDVVHDVQALLLILDSLSRWFKLFLRAYLIDRAMISVICNGILLVYSVVIFDSGPINTWNRVGGFLGVTLRI